MRMYVLALLTATVGAAHAEDVPIEAICGEDGWPSRLVAPVVEEANQEDRTDLLTALMLRSTDESKKQDIVRVARMLASLPAEGTTNDVLATYLCASIDGDVMIRRFASLAAMEGAQVDESGQPYIPEARRRELYLERAITVGSATLVLRAVDVAPPPFVPPPLSHPEGAVRLDQEDIARVELDWSVHPVRSGFDPVVRNLNRVLSNPWAIPPSEYDPDGSTERMDRAGFVTLGQAFFANGKIAETPELFEELAKLGVPLEGCAPARFRVWTWGPHIVTTANGVRWNYRWTHSIVKAKPRLFDCHSSAAISSAMQAWNEQTQKMLGVYPFTSSSSAL
jgi:hypothetical protein